MGGGMNDVGVLMVQLGTPERPDTAAVRRYLAEFLSDRRVVDAPRWWWWPLLHGVILRTRPQRSAALYRRVWRQDGFSPLYYHTRRQADLVAANLTGTARVAWAMRYGQPAIREALEGLIAQGVKRLLVFPLFPQYSGSTTASVVDAVYRALAPGRFLPAWRVAAPFPDDPGMIAALREPLLPLVADPDGFFLFTFHGLPQRYVAEGDPYADQCHLTVARLVEALELPSHRWQVSFQSRFGREPWLEPATNQVLAGLPGRGIRRVVALCPGFVADCLETEEEIGREGKRIFLEAGGERFDYLPCLNDHPAWIAALTARIRQELAGWVAG